MNITIQGVEITLTPDQLKQIDVAVKKQQKPPKLSKEKRFWQLIYGLTIKTDFNKYPNRMFLFNDTDCWVEYNSKNGYFWLKYSTVWAVFENEYYLNYVEIQAFIKDQVEEHFNCKGVTPRASWYRILC